MIVSAQTNMRTDPVSRTPDQLLSLAVQATQRLAPLHPLMARWYALPSNAKEKSIPFENTGAILARMERNIEKDRDRFGDFDELGASLLLANVDNDRDWRTPGLVVLGLDPTLGSHKFRLVGIEPFGEAAPNLMLNAMIGLVEEVKPRYACTDVKAMTHEKALVTYQLDRRLYQHRRYFGWMGFVPAQITHAQIRDAHAVHPVDGLGTVIVSVPGVFDPTDDAQVDKVHRVEMDLASYDLLPVADPNLKG
ncbi:immunity 52 family protein [Stenotrophomonas sp. GD03930]|jgi:hypothetical protein|uniref:Imm52 family immunity protein n=3 Tax=Bacteria TaxID=2 RepID=UPI002449F6E5|nr:Imm52 family immunity protein [Stenotrophomonas sp. GD03930]KAG1450355.1 hypothetical protein G6F57_016423 [Rhizopus arrhizus]MDH1234158.1 immunity 52 family protein [Stenotrophomonas sp. GD03930]HEL4297969.1 immunity 52 family protein [Stenotrophomonas maltophilia]